MTKPRSPTSSAVRPAPPGQVPKEGEQLAQRITVVSRPDYKIDPDSGCWVWQKTLWKGYALAGQRGRAARVYYRLAYGEIPEGHDVHHKCHNRACVNPAHLEAVPHAKHLEDHTQGRSKLGPEQILEIRASRESVEVLAERYGVGKATIGHIWTGLIWGSVGPVARPVVYCGECGKLITEGKRNRRYCNQGCRQRHKNKSHGMAA